MGIRVNIEIYSFFLISCLVFNQTAQKFRENKISLIFNLNIQISAKSSK